MADTKFWIAIFINAAFLVFGIALAIKTNLIKDDSIQPDKPYSYAKTQLFWWVLIIISEFIWCAVYSNGMPQLTSFCLAVLGISAGTTAVGAMIDNSDKNTKGLERHQDKSEYSGFIKDILSDEQGNYSIHRFQSFIFNISIGLIFLWLFFSGNMMKFPVFPDDKYVLGLLGISNAGYAGLKLQENSPRKDTVAELKKQGKTKEEIQVTMRSE